MTSKIVEFKHLPARVSEIVNEFPKATVVQCHGVFDLVHPGHLEHFQQAKKLGDVLIVTITGDRYINKGPNRPFFDQDRRSRFLAALEIVDYVCISEFPTAVESIYAIRPNFYVKGPDYQNIDQDITGKIRDEKEAVESVGGKVVFTEGFTSSSTLLINNALISQDSDLRRWVNDFKHSFSSVSVIKWIDKLSEVDVHILGETILDEYTDCKPLAKSSKDPILAFQRFETRKFLGGVLAIADSCFEWSKLTSVYSTCGENFERYILETQKTLHFEYQFLRLEDRPTIVKHRFVDVVSGNKVFEYYDFNPEPLGEIQQKAILSSLSSRAKEDSLLVLADYGHGFFGDLLIKELCNMNSFIAVNTQSNAGNRGFNTFSKYPRIDFLSLNGGELELELRRKNLNYSEIVPKIMIEKGCKYVVVTLGGDGLLVFDETGESFWTPALASKVVDKIGAGDSVLAIASMLAYLGAPKEIIGLLSSIVAAFEISQLGHKNSLDAVAMKKYVVGLLT